MTWIVILFLAGWIGSCFQTAYDAHMRDLNRLFGKNNYSTIDDETWARMKRNGEKYKERQKRWDAIGDALAPIWALLFVVGFSFAISAAWRFFH
jgi:hypothetical protein